MLRNRWLPVLLSALLPALASAQQGSVDVIQVHGKFLEGNLAGDSPDRSVSVYLPPSYAKEPNRRYPVIYMLHGFGDSDDKWFGRTKHWMNLPPVLDNALKSGSKEMILVMPNAFTRFQNSGYSISAVTGDWEQFIAKELVAFVDGRYRTLPSAASRGLAGHSMGGYGTLRIGMKYPRVFSSLYALSPCCLEPMMDPQTLQKRVALAETIHEAADIDKAGFIAKTVLASGAAWSPNPKHPPFFMDLPWQDGQFQPVVAAKWAANAVLAMVDQHLAELRQLKAIALDVGDQDALAAPVRMLDELLTRNNIAHTMEVYSGNHLNHVGDRIQTKMMPFFSQNLIFADPGERTPRK